mgnify:CR=1 FL=1
MAKKIQLGYKDIESHLAALKTREVKPADVGYEILMAFGKSEKDVSRYREGKGVLKTFDGLLIKGLFCYCAVDTVCLTECLENLKCDEQVRKAAPKIIAVSDGKTVLAYDTRENDTYEQQLAKMHSDFAFFYPLMNVERIHNTEENPADVKAAEKLAKLHDEIRAYNEYNSDDDLHDLNIFITRLLFCFFAEDTGIFAENLFTNFIRRFTKNDGSDLSDMIGQAFRVMNVKDKDRSEDTTKEIDDFPYVNGGLFATDIPIPQMGYKARKIILECGDLNWKDINPDIFGSMIQAVVNPDVRAKEGMHYTSVPNIMKVINPLFMDDLRGDYNRLADAYNQKKSLYEMSANTRYQFFNECKPIINGCNKLLTRMSKMKFFDPACGSGNFLIITYKQLRLLEMDVLKLRMKCQPEQMLDFIDNSCIRLNQFYGIELLDFPHEVAMLSLWLAEHQMNNKFHADFGVNVAALPLHNINQIKCGNACRVDWEEVCPHKKEEEVFVFGNPPYLGGKLQDKEQKLDLAHLFSHTKSFKNLDYISCWFYKAALYIKGTKSQTGFVSTNSICQGEQVSMLWNEIFSINISISFAYLSFKWSNNAKYNAGVTCVIIGLADNDVSVTKRIYNGENTTVVTNITPYLTKGNNIIVSPRTEVLSSGLNKMELGNYPLDGGFLKLSIEEKIELETKYPQISKYIRPLVGGDEFLNGITKYCIWIYNSDLKDALTYPEIKDRVEQVKNFRKNGGDVARTLVDRSHQFRYMKEAKEQMIVVPCTSSERRKYIPCAIYDASYIAIHSLECIYDQDLWGLGIVSSYLHMLWTKAVGGCLGTSIRYSVQLVYNTFPFPSISDAKKSEIEEAATNVLLARANYPEKTLADLYDPDKMPEDLREAHEELDRIVESCYPDAPFANDEARLECLFRLYEKMTANKK